MAGIKWAFIRDLVTNPRAPCSRQASTYSSLEWMVRNTNLAVEPDWTSWRTASIPVIIGMVISTTTTSGLRRRTSETTRSPVGGRADKFKMGLQKGRFRASRNRGGHRLEIRAGESKFASVETNQIFTSDAGSSGAVSLRTQNNTRDGTEPLGESLGR